MSQSCPSPHCHHCGFSKNLLTYLSADEKLSLSLQKSMMSFSKGSTIVKQGEANNQLFFIRMGLVKILRQTNENRRPQIIGIASPRDMLGLINPVASDEYSYTVEAIEPSEICMVELEAVKNLLQTNGEFALRFIEMYSKVSEGILGMRLDLNQLQLRGRVAYVLCYFAQTIYYSNKFTLPISRREIADLIGMRVENVVRILSEMRLEKVISIEGSTIEILNRDKIRWYKLNG